MYNPNHRDFLTNKAFTVNIALVLNILRSRIQTTSARKVGCSFCLKQTIAQIAHKSDSFCFPYFNVCF